MKILAIGAHYDDIELNCLGTLLRLKHEGAEVYLIVCTDGGKARKKEQAIVNARMGYKRVYHLGFTDGWLIHDSELVAAIENIVDFIKPDYVFTHTEDDFHQDHVAVSKAVRAVNRYSRFSVLCFPSQDVKQSFAANCYVDISKYFNKKLKILKNFKSQAKKPWLSEDWITARNVGIDDFKHTEKFYIQFLKL